MVILRGKKTKIKTNQIAIMSLFMHEEEDCHKSRAIS